MDLATLKEMALTAQPKKLSAALKKRAWFYVGPTTAYAAMQSLRLVNDHFDGCDFRDECLKERQKFTPPKRKNKVED
ncbi:MAG: DNA-3-methyladenine glycosylase I [Cyanobacteria bacterium J06598_3]